MAANATTRALRIQKALAGKSITGLQLGEIAKAIGENSVNTLRTLQEMQKEGFITQFEHNKNYALSTACLAIATAHSLEIGQAQDKIASINQRVTAHAHQFLS